jgi:hypothetical protein
MEEGLIQFVTTPPIQPESSELLVFAQIATPFVALATPFLVFGLAAIRNWFRETRSAGRLRSCVQKEAKLLAFILEDSDGHWRNPKRIAPHTNEKHYLDVTPIVGSPSIWATSLAPSDSARVSDLWDAITRYNKWVGFYCAVKAGISKRRNYTKILTSLDQLWVALQAIDPSIQKPQHLVERDERRQQRENREHD